MKAVILILVVAAFFVAQTEGVHNLANSYPFSQKLNHNPSYILHWKIDLNSKVIGFAVNASVGNGWVGFGLSKSSQMIGSDVVIGWVDDQGQVKLHVRLL